MTIPGVTTLALGEEGGDHPFHAGPDRRRERAVRIHYTNWQGETAWRTVLPGRIVWGINEWHGQEPQWLLEAFDLDKRAQRSFAMKDIHEWKPVDSQDGYGTI